MLVGNDFVAPQMPPSTLASAPVLRRRASRGRINAPIEPVDPGAALIEQALADFAGTASDEADRDVRDAGGVGSASALLGEARVRGAAVPEAAPSSASGDAGGGLTDAQLSSHRTNDGQAGCAMGIALTLILVFALLMAAVTLWFAIGPGSRGGAWDDGGLMEEPG